MRRLTAVKQRAQEWREAREPALHSPQEATVRPFVAARCLSTGFLTCEWSCNHE
jgi:hypothetical protein